MLGDNNQRTSVNPIFIVIPVILVFVVAIVLGIGAFVAFRAWQNGKAKEEAREREPRSTPPAGPPTITSESPGSPRDPLPQPTVGSDPEAPSPTDPDETAPRVVSGGVLNGKAISLPKPAYPPAAHAAHVSGQVTVQITIGESGNVISATAVSGHPLLRSAAVTAALGAKFSPTSISGRPVKVTGTIIYNFTDE